YKTWGPPKLLAPQFADLRFSVPTFVQWGKKIINHKDSFNDTLFYYPKNGFQQLWDRLAEKLQAYGMRIVYGATVERLNVQNQRAVSVTISQNGTQEEIPSEWVVSTVPAPQFIKTADGLAPKGLATSFPCRGLLIVIFFIDQEQCLPARVVICPESRFLFNRLTEQNQFSRETVPSGKSVVLADIIIENDSSLWERSDEDIIQLTSRQFVETGLVSAHQIKSTFLVRVDEAYPLPSTARELAQQQLNQAVQKFENIVTTGRFASSDYNNSHTAMKKGMLLAQWLVQKKTLAGWFDAAEQLRQRPIRD
ncbi:MAG: hypothetical protein HY537_13765, partial [Deltaproteobacteria bacterium]|nr:hypothetical protein [Deltaproteobacteria bacterium]